MKKIVLTGSIASGKSTVATYLRGQGYPVLDADQIAHALMQPGQGNYQALVEYFGLGILDDRGEIHRTQLGQIVFNQEAALKKLNDITHPRIYQEIRRQLQALEHDQSPWVFVDIPLYYEGGQTLAELVDQVWLVYCRPDQQVQRLMDRNALSLEEAQIRIDSQMPLETKAQWADQVIDNSGSVKETLDQVASLLAQCSR